MRSIQRPNQYLRLRHDVWHYVRRVPKSVRHIDERVLIYRSLETDSRKVAITGLRCSLAGIFPCNCRWTHVLASGDHLYDKHMYIDCISMSDLVYDPVDFFQTSHKGIQMRVRVVIPFMDW